MAHVKHIYTPEQKARRSLMWNTWAMTPADRDGWITHVFEEGTDRAKAGRAICGAPSAVGGGVNMEYDDYRPGCIRCCKSLIKAGLLPPKQ